MRRTKTGKFSGYKHSRMARSQKGQLEERTWPVRLSGGVGSLGGIGSAIEQDGVADMEQ